ncbi:hypothetical protein O6H91_08G077200 [Diphasiastrum complanatum]|uniref:Uncharacterized protein n=1 Tax=Diphasiastrum complanatum TaxID=34168 RepID=A0ACC2CZC4_DIPCM|nr:hypothetical protein O6H91_08G077200 [Diphasiastrum complanatum]
MAITTIKLRVEKKLHSMSLLSLLRRKRHRKTASKPNLFAESNFDRPNLKTKSKSIDHEEVATPINDSSASCLTSDDWSHVRPHALHQSACPVVSSKTICKENPRGKDIVDSCQDCMEQRISALCLLISFNTILLILISKLSYGWKRFLEIAFSATLSIKKALADILFVILDLSFGLFVIMLYSRELSVRPLALALDELKLLSTYFFASS